MEKMLLNNSKIDYIISSGNYHRKVYKNGSSFLLKTLTSSGGNEGYSVTITANKSYERNYTDCSYRDSISFLTYQQACSTNVTIVSTTSTFRTQHRTYSSQVTTSSASISSSYTSGNHTYNRNPYTTSYSFPVGMDSQGQYTGNGYCDMTFYSTTSTSYNIITATARTNSEMQNLSGNFGTIYQNFNPYSIPTEYQTERLYTYSNSGTYMFSQAPNASTTYTRYYTSVSSSTRSNTENFDFNGSNTTSISSNNSELLNMFSDTTMVSTKYEGSSSELCTLLITKTISSENNTYYLTY